MIAETTTETSHKNARHSKASPMNDMKKSRRHANGSGLKRTAGRMVGALAISRLTRGAADGVTDHLTDLKKGGLKTVAAVEHKIRKHPKSSVLIAFSIGYLWARVRRWF